MPTRAPARRARVVFTALLCTASLLAGAAATYFMPKPEAAAPAASHQPAAQEPRSLSALGEVQPAGGIISIYGPPEDRILKFAQPLHVGQSLKSGDPLVILESQRARESEVKLARVQVQQAEQQQDAIRKAADAKLAELDAETGQLESRKKEDLAVQDDRICVFQAQAEQARTQLGRLDGLATDRVSAAERDQARLAVEVADGQLNAARATRTQTENTYKRQSGLAVLKRTSIIAERDQALQQVPLESARASERAAQQRLDECTLKVPPQVATATVLRVIGHAGQTTGTQPILELAAGDAIAVLTEVYEDDLDQLYAGLAKPEGVTARVKARALEGSKDKPLSGIVESDQVARMVAHNQLLSLNPRADQDRRVVQVRVLLDPPSADRARKYIGLQVDVLLKP